MIAVIAGPICADRLGALPARRSQGHPADTGTAQHYLPADGAQLSFPMLHFTLLGALCMLGTLWLVIYARTSTRAGALAVAVLAVYAWSLLSMLTTLAGHHAAVVPAAADADHPADRGGRFRLHRGDPCARRARPAPANARSVVAVATAVGAIGAVTFSQDIPDVLRSDIVVAYTDTDGTASAPTAARPAPSSTTARSTPRSSEVTGRPRDETVVLTADYSFLSYYPYYGFQGLTSHYANPLAQFDKRATAIENWATLTDADQFIKALDDLPWQPPTVFLMRRGANDTYTLRLASDVYPNQPNVRRYHVALDAALFDDPRFDVSTVGPFVLAIRKPMMSI